MLLILISLLYISFSGVIYCDSFSNSANLSQVNVDQNQAESISYNNSVSSITCLNTIGKYKNIGKRKLF